MKHYLMMASCAFCAVAAGAAYADCAEDLARMTSETDVSAGAEGGPNDVSGGTTASSSTTADTDAGSEQDGIVKDGSHAPLEDAEDAASGVAISEQDVQAQQEGELPAAEQAAAADAEDGSAERAALIDRARTALAAGDEAACRDALKDALKEAAAL